MPLQYIQVIDGKPFVRYVKVLASYSSPEMPQATRLLV
jgi:hypothetical protein